MSTLDGSVFRFPRETETKTLDAVRPDWRLMTRDVFDVDAPTVQLALDVAPVTDGCGTVDLFTLLDGSLSDA